MDPISDTIALLIVLSSAAVMLTAAFLFQRLRRHVSSPDTRKPHITPDQRPRHGTRRREAERE